MSSPYRFASCSRKQGTLSTGCLRVFFLPFFLIGLAIFWFATLWPLLQCAAARRWAETRCTVDSCQLGYVVSHDSRGRTTYRVEIVYHYDFRGARYSSSHFQFTTASTGGRARVQRVVDQYPAGRETVCYVNPDHPTESVILRDPTFTMLLGLIGLPFAIIGALGIRYASRLTGPQRTSRKNAVPSFTPVTGEPVDLKPQVTARGKFFLLLAFAVFWNGIMSVFVYFVFFSPDHQGTPLVAKIFVGFFVAIGVLILLATIGSFLAIFNPQVVLQARTPAVPLGGEYHFEWSVRGRADRLKKLRITLVGREEAVYQSGENDSHLVTHNFAEIPVLETMEREIISQGHARVTIPSDLMHTFRGDSNRVSWRLEVRAEIPRWPDLEQEHTIQVLPHGATVA